jgi:glycerol-3-phosphate dehydrogenase
MQFGATLTEAEVNWQIEKEFAMTVDDIVWRRTKLGLRLSEQQVSELDTFLTNKNMGLQLAV